MKKPTETLSPLELFELEHVIDLHTPRVLSPEWTPIEVTAVARAFRRVDGLGVIVEAEKHDGKCWLHMSLSRVDAVPSYEDMVLVKRMFIGRRRAAIQVFPPEGEHVNIHPFCLHMWAPVYHELAIPDFRNADGSL